MKIRCKYCGEVIDLRDRIAIEMYNNGVMVRCRSCLADIKREEEETR